MLVYRVAFPVYRFFTVVLSACIITAGCFGLLTTEVLWQNTPFHLTPELIRRLFPHPFPLK